MLNKNTVSIMVLRNGRPSTFASASVTSPRYVHVTTNLCACNVDRSHGYDRYGAGAGVRACNGHRIGTGRSGV